jgi:RNA recognition motif-containing protein
MLVIGAEEPKLTFPLFRIVEYQTREQAQNAVATLSNQNLMGRLVYVREVRYIPSQSFLDDYYFCHSAG